MKIDRLLTILVLLQSRKMMTSRQLAEEFSVSERTIFRDMETLSANGFPIYAERGKNGGWKLLDSFKLPWSSLKVEEMGALLLQPADSMMRDLGMKSVHVNGRVKLMQALPYTYQTIAKTLSERILIDSISWKVNGLNRETLRTIKQAVFDQKIIRAKYRKVNGEEKEALLHPLGIVLKGSTWYLVALRNKDLRTYRVSRIKEVFLTEDSFERPEHFQLSSYWEETTADFVKQLPSYPVKIQASSSVFSRLHFSRPFIQEIERHGDVMTVHFQTEEEALHFIAGFGARVEVLEPSSLIPKLRAMAHETLALYTHS